MGYQLEDEILSPNGVIHNPDITKITGNLEKSVLLSLLTLRVIYEVHVIAHHLGQVGLYTRKHAVCAYDAMGQFLIFGCNRQNFLTIFEPNLSL